MIPFKLIGKARSVFAYLNILATTEPMETDPDWWLTDNRLDKLLLLGYTIREEVNSENRNN